MKESEKGETQAPLNKPDATSNTSTDEPAMAQVDNASEAIQILPENCNIANAATTHVDDDPVHETQTDEEKQSSPHQADMNDDMDKLVADSESNSSQEQEDSDFSEEAGVQSAQDSDAKQDILSSDGDVAESAESMENLESIDHEEYPENMEDWEGLDDHECLQESLLHTESSCTDDEKSLKDEPVEDDLPLDENELPVFDTTAEERMEQFRFSAETDDPSKAMRIAAEAASSLLPSTAPSGPSQSTVSQSSVQKGIKKRIDVMSLPIVDNPLQKEGRHTVIRGRLPDDHPFLIAAENLGYKLVSKKLDGFGEGKDEESRRDKFHKDLREFLKEIHSKNTKLPIIGGGNLDLYGLMKEVLLLGGVENVVKKRAFRIVAQQLELPKSCTSAAYVLKGAYEKFLYFYETRLVYGTWPDNTGRRVDMKSRVTEQKQREKLANQANQTNCAKKRRRSDPNDTGKPPFRRRALQMDSRVLQMLSTISNDAEATHKYLKILASENGDGFDLPDWAVQVPEGGSYLEVIERSQKMDDSDEVHTSGEVILLAVAECFLLISSTGSPVEPARARDLGLAKAICLLPISASMTRKAQACLFSLLVQATKLPNEAVLASNQSANGLVDGIFSLVQIFYTQNVDKLTGDTIPFINSRNHVINRDAAAAFCGLRVLGNLTKEQRNRPPIAKHAGIGKILLPMFQMVGLYRDFSVTVLDILQDISTDVSKVHIDGMLEGILPLLESACTEESPDFDVSTRALTVLSWATEELDEGSMHVASVITMVSRLLHCQISIVNTPALGVIVNSLVEKFAEAVSDDERFIEGMFILLRDTRCTSLVAESLIRLHRLVPLNEFAVRAGLEFGGANANREEADLLDDTGNVVEELTDEFEV